MALQVDTAREHRALLSMGPLLPQARGVQVHLPLPACVPSTACWTEPRGRVEGAAVA